MTEEPQSHSSAGDEPVTEERAAVTAKPATSERATAQHPSTPSDPVALATQMSEPGPAQSVAAQPVAAEPAAVKPPAQTRPPIPPPVPPAVETGPQPGPSPIDKVTALVNERPEVGVGGAFAGGIVFALILKRLGR